MGGVYHLLTEMTFWKKEMSQLNDAEIIHKRVFCE